MTKATASEALRRKLIAAFNKKGPSEIAKRWRRVADRLSQSAAEFDDMIGWLDYLFAGHRSWRGVGGQDRPGAAERERKLLDDFTTHLVNALACLDPYSVPPHHSRRIENIEKYVDGEVSLALWFRLDRKAPAIIKQLKSDINAADRARAPRGRRKAALVLTAVDILADFWLRTLGEPQFEAGPHTRTRLFCETVIRHVANQTGVGQNEATAGLVEAMRKKDSASGAKRARRAGERSVKTRQPVTTAAARPSRDTGH